MMGRMDQGYSPKLLPRKGTHGSYAKDDDGDKMKQLVSSEF